MINKKKIILIVIAAAAFSVVVWFFVRPDPSVVLLQAQKNLAEAETFRYDAEFEVKGVWARKELPLGSGEEDILLKGTVQTDISRENLALPESSSSFDMKLGSQGDELRVRGESRKKDGRHYLRLAEASDGLFPGIGQAIGKWIHSDAPFMEFLIPEEEKYPEESTMSLEQVMELQRGFSSVPVFRYEETLKPEIVDGVKNLHYRIGIHEKAVAALLLRRRELATGIPAEPKDYAKLLDSVSSWGSPEGEIWIGKKDRRIRRLDLTTTLPEELGGAVISIRTFISRYGQNVGVIAPESEDVSDLFGKILAGRLSLAGDRTVEAVRGETPLPATLEPEKISSDTERDSDGDGLIDTQEFFYGSDAWNPDTDGDGWSDGTEVANGQNPVGPGVLFGFGL